MFGVATGGSPGEWYLETMSRYLSLCCVLISKMQHPSLGRQNTDICLGPFRGFGGLVPPIYVKIVLSKKVLLTPKKSSALAYGVKKVFFGRLHRE